MKLMAFYTTKSNLSSTCDNEDLIPKEPYKAATDLTPGYTVPLVSKNVLRRLKTNSPSILSSANHLLSSTTSNSLNSGAVLIPYSLDYERSQFSVQDGMSPPQSPTIAYVTPQKRMFKPSIAVQTDCLSIDLNQLVNVEDINRSCRINGLLNTNSGKINSPTVGSGFLDHKNIFSSQSHQDIPLVTDRVKYLEHQLHIQKQVNQDLKNLLLSSFGTESEVKRIVEELIEERAKLTYQLEADLERNKMLNDSLDRNAIEADMWRSKFVAGRVMLEEIAGWKAQLNIRYEEACKALRMMLQEHEETRNHLAGIYSLLLENTTPKQAITTAVMLKDGKLSPHHQPSHHADDSANIHNILELSETCHNMLETFFSEPPPEVTTNLMCTGCIPSNNNSGNSQVSSKFIKRTSKNHQGRSKITSGLTNMCNDFTDAERAALDASTSYDKLSFDWTRAYQPSFQSQESKLFERLTMGSCKKCKGEVTVL